MSIQRATMTLSNEESVELIMSEMMRQFAIMRRVMDAMVHLLKQWKKDRFRLLQVLRDAHDHFQMRVDLPVGDKRGLDFNPLDFLTEALKGDTVDALELLLAVSKYMRLEGEALKDLAKPKALMAQGLHERITIPPTILHPDGPGSLKARARVLACVFDQSNWLLCYTCDQDKDVYFNLEHLIRLTCPTKKHPAKAAKYHFDNRCTGIDAHSKRLTFLPGTHRRLISNGYEYLVTLQAFFNLVWKHLYQKEVKFLLDV